MSDEFSAGSLRIERVDTGEAIRLVWRGSSRDRQPQKVIGPWLDGVLADAARDQKAVEMRFEDLEYFNSSTVMALVGAIRAGAAKKVPLRLVYAGDLEWQRLSFEPMRVFAKSGAVELVESAPRGSAAAVAAR